MQPTRIRTNVMQSPSIRRCFASAALGIAWLATHAAAQGTTERVSVGPSGVEGDGASYNWRASMISSDGRIVAFQSAASNLVAGDTNGAYDVFVHDRSTGRTELVSIASSGLGGGSSQHALPVLGNGDSFSPSISADGQIVAFESSATNLVGQDTNGRVDVFVHDRSTGVTERVSVASTGAQGNGDSGALFAGSRESTISADGRFVAFTSNASNLVAGDTNGLPDVFVHDRSTGITERVSVAGGLDANGASDSPSLSADGRFVAFESAASNLDPSGDNNSFRDVFVFDRSSTLMERVSNATSGAEGNSDSWGPAISADGQIVAFQSWASNLVPNDTNGFADVFVHTPGGAIDRVSVDSSGAQGNWESYSPEISANGRFVTFNSSSSNFHANDTNGTWDVFVFDRSTRTLETISVDALGTEGDADSHLPSISANGEIVAFFSYATNLVAGDTNGVSDLFVHERCTVDASWSNYGAGVAGTNGVPAFTSRSNPVLGTTFTLDLANSSGNYTYGLLFIGLQQARFDSGWGGDLLVVPMITTILGLAPTGTVVSGALPFDGTLCGVAVDLQAIEGDPGAANGISFTQGLELLLGR